MLFTAHNISSIFDDHDNSRGRTYQNQGRIKDLRIDKQGKNIIALVQGTANLPYRVEIEISKKRAGIDFVSHCTCPVGYMCKHAAAALYEAIAQENRQHEEKRPGRRGKQKNTGLNENTRQWLVGLEELLKTQESSDDARIVYFLTAATSTLTITPALQNRLREGTWGHPRPQTFHQLHMLASYGNLLDKNDRVVLNLASLGDAGKGRMGAVWTPPDDPSIVDLFMQRILATGRAFADEEARIPLTLGEELTAKLDWELLDKGHQKPSLSLPRAGLRVLSSASPWYVDVISGETGPLLYPVSSETVNSFLALDMIEEKEAELIREHLKKKTPALPTPYRITHRKSTASKPTPRLVLKRVASIGGELNASEAIAFLTYDYDGLEIHPQDKIETVQKRQKNEAVVKPRPKGAERNFLKRLKETGLIQHPLTTEPFTKEPDPRGLALVPSDEASPWFWLDFVQDFVPDLKKEGFDIHIATDFESKIIEPDSEDIDAAFTQSGDWWFSLDLGISIDGERIQLLPVLVAMIRSLNSLDDVERLTSVTKCYAPLPDGRKIALPAQRIQTILKTLVELFENKALDKDGTLNVSMDLAAAFLKLEGITRKRWLGDGQLRKLVEKLGTFEGIKKKALPKGLKAKLRSYQVDGYNWLHFLGEYGLSGILADDMGLGKTVQALAYLCALKESKKLDSPCLIVMPTSLIANWQSETERFTPSLKTLTLHGKDRASKFSDIPKADIVFTTYPLLPRDDAKLKEHNWSIIILDEAQAIKNPSAKMTQAACSLEGKQRLCLTGTPVENHLGEAWSLFTFLMPGLLGDHRKFGRVYRTPIEKGGDEDRKDLLARRLRPFVLRRLKSEVAKELPPKTEIIRHVTLADDQRDLYEVVRHVMNERVREEIEAKGVGRSQIIILDALLKLRQTCCDPRLVKLAAARKVKNSAKLEELMEMLPTLIEEGRRILLFSQFTSMLDLIKPELAKAEIPFVELRGSTKDRKTPIIRFQKEEVPLFLISLKAGGTGLNLTAADTVIHYDPWWNPSVENQATDRAHRIGQDKPVFVYKLIAQSTVEERILELQSKKAGFASALFGDKPGAAASLSPDDLQFLME